MVLLTVEVLAQGNKKTSNFVLLQYNHTIYDLTRPNNPWSLGAGLQTFLKIKPVQLTAELTADVYLEDDKVLRTGFNGEPLEDLGTMINLFFGASLSFNNFHLAIAAGPSLINGNISLGLKPSAGILFSKNKNWLAKFSFINIFYRHPGFDQDFGSWSIGIGKKLF